MTTAAAAHTDIPVLPMTQRISKSRDWKSLPHLLIAPYASIEQHFQRVVIIDRTVAEPTWLVTARARRRRRSNTYALILPNLTALTLDLATAHTQVVTDYIGVRLWSLAERQRANRFGAHGLPLIAEYITDRGPILLPGAHDPTPTEPAT